jgi:hypothetical protein
MSTSCATAGRELGVGAPQCELKKGFSLQPELLLPWREPSALLAHHSVPFFWEQHPGFSLSNYPDSILSPVWITVPSPRPEVRAEWPIRVSPGTLVGISGKSRRERSPGKRTGSSSEPRKQNKKD